METSPGPLTSQDLRKKIKPHAKVEEGDAEDVFKMIEVIGEGSFGTVILCRHIKKKKNYAIKIIDFTREISEEDVDAELAELDVYRETNSPFIVKFFGVYEKDSSLLIAMEFCSGGSVSDIYEYTKTPLNEKQIASVAYCVTKGLDHLHSKNITHRDIKGANILLTQSGVAKLTDFGVSKIQEKGTKMQTVVGSPYWMAPEVISMGAYDNLADIWSLGVTCIEMAEGAPPRGDIHPMKVLRMIPSQPEPTLKEPEKWSKDFQNFLSKCLQKKPQNRSSCKELLKHPFLKGGKKMYRKELKQLVDATIAIVTEQKRIALRAKQETTEKKEIINNSTFFSLNSRRHSVRTFTRVEGVTDDTDTGSVIIRTTTGVREEGGEVEGGRIETGTIIIADTITDGEAGNNDDAFGVDTSVIITENDGTVRIKE